MKFEGDFALWQQRVAEGPAGRIRRSATCEALAARPGGSYLDLGCGGGQLLHDLAEAMEGRGRAVGVDISPDQIAAARARCAGQAIVSVEQADATDLPFAEGSFDGLGSIQVFEYLPDIEATLTEITRVVKPGGRLATVSVLWDAFLFTGPEEALNATITEAWRAHCPHQMLPAALPSRLTKAGFTEIAQKPLTLFETTYGEEQTGYWVSKIMAAFAVGQGVPESDSARWLTELEEAFAEARYGFLSVPVLTTARRA